MSDDAPKKRHLIKGWAGRTWTSARVGAAFGRVAARKVVDHALDRESEDRMDADALVERLDQLKGLMMKVGQMASYLDGTLPEAGQRVLRKLQRDAEPMDWDTVRQVVREDLGAEPEALFDRFERRPFAAASIGQVHLAEIDGRKLAVKVQYPEIANALQIDFSNLRKAGFLASFGTAFDHRSMLDELRDRVNEECQYRLEAARQLYFRELLANDPNVIVPDVITDRCGDRVLTSELVDGLSFYDFVATAPAEARNRAGLVLYGVAFRMIFGHSAFNGDPHPGNYLFLPNGRVALLDYGCVRFFPRRQIELWKGIASAVLANDAVAFKEPFVASGFVAKEHKFDFDYNWRMMRYLYEPMTQVPFRYTHEYVRDSYGLFFKDNPNVRQTRMPPEWVLANRLQWGLNSVLAHLGAEGDFATEFRNAVALPTRDPAPPEPIPARVA